MWQSIRGNPTRTWCLSVVVYGSLNGLLTIWLSFYAWPYLNQPGLAEAAYWEALLTYRSWLQAMIIQAWLVAAIAILSSLSLASRIRKRWLVAGTLCVLSQAIANFWLFVYGATGSGV
jgi:hypothetical protein